MCGINDDMISVINKYGISVCSQIVSINMSNRDIAEYVYITLKTRYSYDNDVFIECFNFISKYSDVFTDEKFEEIQELIVNDRDSYSAYYFANYVKRAN